MKSEIGRDPVDRNRANHMSNPSVLVTLNPGNEADRLARLFLLAVPVVH